MHLDEFTFLNIACENNIKNNLTSELSSKLFPNEIGKRNKKNVTIQSSKYF